MSELPMPMPRIAVERAPKVPPAPTGPLVPGSDWGVIDHVCGECFARLLGRVADGRAHYRCSGCGQETPTPTEPLRMTPGPNGRRAPTICACHLRWGTRDAGIRCVVNDRRSPDNPTEVVARQLL